MQRSFIERSHCVEFFTLSSEKKSKRIVSRDEYFLKICRNKQGLSAHALLVFTIFCFLVDERLRGFTCSFEVLTYFENPSSTSLQRP